MELRISICHGMTRKNTEKTEAEELATDEHGITRKEEHIFQSRMRERRNYSTYP